MKGKLIVSAFLFTLIVLGCRSSDSNAESDTNTFSVGKDSLNGSPVTVQDTLAIEARLCEALMEIANHIDSQGYVCDSIRLNHVYTELADNKKLFGRKHVFYICEPEETCIGGRQYHRFDSLLRLNREPIIAYFFTTPDKINNYFLDGIVEQWELNDTAAARAAAKLIIETEMGFGHNSPPMVCYLDTRMYVFRSRSTPGMYAILPFFREFVARTGAVVIRRDNGWK